MSQSHFFEGPEKKLEVLFKKNAINLLEKPKTYWEDLVRLAAAQILSEIHTESCSAYLLSESSLFVWKDRITLITCGTTELIKAADFLLKDFSGQVEEIFFERKNEYYPGLQKTTASEDMQALKDMAGGEALRFGRKDDHHVYVFNKNFSIENQSLEKVKTLELLMYGLRGEFKDFCVDNESKQNQLMQSLKEILPGFKIDPFFFNPVGFSFNALKGGQYATMHVTPQGQENYLSFEMDQFDLKSDKKILEDLVKLCKPTSYDTIFFKTDKIDDDFSVDNYLVKQMSSGKTESGYQVYYKHYFDNLSINTNPTQI